MYASELNKDTLITMLQTLSLRKRHGILEVVTEDDTFQISLTDGCIVQVNQNSLNMTQALCERLVSAGYLEEKVLGVLQSHSLAPDQLREVLVMQDYVSEDTFFDAFRAVQSDCLYNLRHLQQAEAKFAPQVVRVPKELSLNIYPGQLLLDLISLQLEEEKFVSLFGYADTDDVQVYPKGECPPGLTKDEREVWEKVAEGWNVSSIMSESLLNVYEAREALLGLFDLDCIMIERVATDARPNDSISPNAVDELSVESLSRELESYLSEPTEEVIVPKLETFELLPEEAVSDVVMPQEPLSQSRSENQLDSKKAPRTVVKAQSAAHIEHVVEVKKHAINEQQNVHGKVKVPLRAYLFEFQNRLLDPEVVRAALLTVMIGFLALLAHYAPAMLEQWFEALSNFTSRSSNSMLQ